MDRSLNIWEAYLQYGWLFFCFHLFLFVLWLLFRISDLFRWWPERKAFDILKKNDFASVSDDEAEINKLTTVTLSMVQRGDILSPEAIRSRLAKSLGRNDSIAGALINGFVISGLMGTLYNLWQLGPEFWDSLIEKNMEIGKHSIGLAFSVSIFGLGYALILMLIDSLIIRHPREKFVRGAANGIFDAAAQKLPPKEGAAVAQALENFYHASKGFLTELKVKHEEVSQRFIAQVQNSSTQLIETLNSVSTEWETLAKSARENIYDLGARLETEVKNLTEATVKTGEVLNGALSSIQETEKVSTSLSGVYSQANRLIGEIRTELTKFNMQWQADMGVLSQAHIERMEKVSKAFSARLEQASKCGWERYETETQKWHEQNVGALNRFASDIGKSMSNWAEERNRLGDYINRLIEVWKGEITRTIEAMQNSMEGLQEKSNALLNNMQGMFGRTTTSLENKLGQLGNRIQVLAELSDKLTRSNATALQELHTLQNAIRSFSANFSSGNPLGKAMNSLTAAITKLEATMGHDGGDSLVSNPNLADALPDPTINEIRLDLRAIANSVEQIRASSTQRQESKTVSTRSSGSADRKGTSGLLRRLKTYLSNSGRKGKQ